MARRQSWTVLEVGSPLPHLSVDCANAQQPKPVHKQETDGLACRIRVELEQMHLKNWVALSGKLMLLALESEC